MRVYPRVGGGNNGAESTKSRQAGLSPRGRGKQRRCHTAVYRGGSIPAWAGETA